MGPCAGGAVYSPAMTDFTIMVEDSSYMFVTGPNVVKTVTNEEVSSEELGGASAHSTKSGVTHLTASNDIDCIAQIKQLLSYMPQSCEDKPAKLPYELGDEVRAVLETIVPESANQPYDMREVIEGITDEASFYEIHKNFAENIVVGFARLGGRSIGIVANQPISLAGVLDVDSSRIAARFTRFCDCFNIPILTLVDVPGFLPGTAQEYGGVIKHGAKLLFAYGEATVPKVTLITRKAYGGAYDVMASKHLRGDVNYAWPSAEIAVMGAKGATEILYRSELGDEEKIAARTKEYEDRFANPFVAAEMGFIDDVIIPHNTRKRIARAFASLKNKDLQNPWKKHDNIPL